MILVNGCSFSAPSDDCDSWASGFYDKGFNKFKHGISNTIMQYDVVKNVAVGGSKTSQHTKGMAIDMQGTNGLLNAQIFHYIKDNLEFDQLIWEYGTNKEPAWVHVSYNKGKNRGQVLYIGVK